MSLPAQTSARTRDDWHAEAKVAIGAGQSFADFYNGAEKFPGYNEGDLKGLWDEEALRANARIARQQRDAFKRATSHPIASGKAIPSPQSFEPLPVVQITCAADIKPEPIRWLWPGWLARGKLHILAGKAGTGKTTIAIALAASVSMGGRFPDGTRAPGGNVLIWSGEDSPKDSLVPKLIAAGADMKRVHFVGDVRHGDEIRSFDPATDIKSMADAMIHIGDVSLLIVDPVVNAVAGDSHKNTEVRRDLQPLVDFGEKLGCAVLGISHFAKGTSGKDPLERIIGSVAFGALPRVVMAAGRIIEGGVDRRIFCRAKSNIGPDGGGFEYELLQKEIEGHKGIFSNYSVWGAALEGTATQLLAESEPDDGEGASAELFLHELLADGAVPVKQVRDDAHGASHSWRTIERAKKALGIESVKEGMDRGWVWKLPAQDYEGRQENPKDATQNTWRSSRSSEESPSPEKDEWWKK